MIGPMIEKKVGRPQGLLAFLVIRSLPSEKSFSECMQSGLLMAADHVTARLCAKIFARIRSMTWIGNT